MVLRLNVLVSTAFEMSMLLAAASDVAEGLSAGSLVFLELPAAEVSFSIIALSMRKAARWPRRTPQHGRSRRSRPGDRSDPPGPDRGTRHPRRAGKRASI
jgi:hypothetical protein